MKLALFIILMIIGNLCLYWILFGKNKFDQKFNLSQNPADSLPSADQLKELNKLHHADHLIQTEGER